MPTVLVTRKMSPELAARVRASVEGRRRAPGSRLAPRAVSLLRVTLLLIVMALVLWIGLNMRRAQQELERDRAALLERVRQESSRLSAREKALAQRLTPWLGRLSEAYAGDFVKEELRAPGALEAALKRATVYLRTPLSRSAGEAHLARSAAESFKDAFVLCLIEPPQERSEKLLRKQARRATTALGMQPTRHVVRLQEALITLPLLSPEWAARVANADDRLELERRKKAFDLAPFAAARHAAKAEQMLLVIDEPSDQPAAAELDGERPHAIRVALVELATDELLLRLRRSVDPSWLSPASRAELARGIDSCALALDVRAAVRPGPPAPPPPGADAGEAGPG